MATPRITIEVKNILQGGRTCSNPTIEAHLVSGLVMPCPVVGGFIELQLDGLENGYCFDLVIDCEDCESCPPQVRRICLCDNNDDCSQCETCTNGICVSICNDGQFCDNGSCKGCLVDGDCLCNKECLNGECTCPPNLPFEVNGCCYECDENVVTGCEVCVGGRLVAIDCGETYLLDPNDCTCKQCLDSGDCTEPHTCCVDGSCGCCPGYYYDPTAGGCIVIPDCSTTDDCPDCFNCVNGTCVESVCPSGYKRTSIPGHCCVKECDCENPSCPSGYNCMEYDESTCYCKPCEGACVDNTDCAEGCGCYDGNCKPKPSGCDGPCYTGADCGVGCGCIDGECVDCKTLGCNNNNDCLLASGCTCVDNSCEGSPCDKPCTDGADCDNNCGCEDGMCKDCADVPCTNTDDCPEGCLCNNGICGKNPCAYVHCTTPNDCGENCGCKDGNCVPCETLDCVTSECNDTPGCNCNGGNCEDAPRVPCDDDLRIERVDGDCTLIATLDMNDCCVCPDIVLHVTATFVTTTLTVVGYLRKGTLASSPLLSATGVTNELPLSGQVKFVVRQDEIEVDNNGAPTGMTRSTQQTSTKDYSGLDTNTQAFTIHTIGSTYTDAGKKWKVLHICVAIENVATFRFVNECQYKANDKELVCDANGSGLLQLTKLTRCKTPLFTWSESSNNSSWAVMYKRYSTRQDANTYVDTATGSDGLEACKYYKVAVDCGCDLLEHYDCHGEDLNGSKLAFCDPADLDITVNDPCLLDVDIAEVEVCTVMSGAGYKLYVNGILDGSYTATAGVLFSGGKNIVRAVPIKEIKLTFDCDQCGDCTITKTLDLQDDPCNCSVDLLTVTVDTTDACSSGFDYTITDGTGPYTVVLKKGVTTIYTTTKATDGTYTYNNILANGTYTLTVTDAFGCIKTKGFVISTCCQIVVTGLSYDCTTRTISGTITAPHGSGTYVLEVGSGVHSWTDGAGAFSEVFDLMDGIYSFKVTDNADGDCFWLGNLYVGCGGIDLTIAAICDGTSSGIRVSSPINGSAPYIAEVYIAQSVDVDGSGCPTNPLQLQETTTTFPGTISSGSWNSTYECIVKLTDATGRSKCFPAIDLLDCAENSFDFTTRASCNGTQKRICITANKTATYSVTIGSDPAFDATLTAGVEVCYDTVLVDGTYAVTLVNDAAVTKTHNVVLTACDDFSVSYSCTTGLTILKNAIAWTGQIRVDGQPSTGYWNYTGPNTVFLADTTPNHVINLYTSGTQVYSTTVSSINCCDLQIEGLTYFCDPGTGEATIEFDIVDAINPAGAHTIEIKQGGLTVQSEIAYVGTHFSSNSLINGFYTVIVTADAYHVPNVGLGNAYECNVTREIEVNCTPPCGINSVAAVYKGEIDCSNNVSSNTWRIKATNGELFSMNYQIWRKANTLLSFCPDGTDCSTTGYSLVYSGTISPSSTDCHSFPSAGDATACFLVKFIDAGDSSCFKCLKPTLEVV